ncbi:hypothetical protein [Actinoplanes sp. NPDC049599]|uniref:hypothetical protein n=1 Tax=Actinoplanes sp. NPDC049599 TaxID=3363903 RepID=UPI0037AC895F
MADDLDGLARELRALAAHLDVGEPADQRAAVRARLTGPAPAPVRRWTAWWRRVVRTPARRVTLAALAALIAVVAGVAPARAAVTDAVGGLLRLAGIEVRREPPPGGLPAQPGPLPSTRTVALVDARRAALFPVGVPAALGAPERVEIGDPDPAGAPRVVSLRYPGGVRLDEFDGTVTPIFFKTAPEARWVTVGPADGIWVPAPHPVSYVGRDGVERTETTRPAGPTLIWTDGEVTFRLEGLTDLAAARRIALSVA